MKKNDMNMTVGASIYEAPAMNITNIEVEGFFCDSPGESGAGNEDFEDGGSIL